MVTLRPRGCFTAARWALVLTVLSDLAHPMREHNGLAVSRPPFDIRIAVWPVAGVLLVLVGDACWG